MRVLHIVSGDQWAGAEAQVCALLTALHGRDDIEVAAVVLNPGELALRLDRAGVEVFAFEESRQNLPQLLRKLRAAMRAWQPDIVHTHKPKQNILGGFAAWTLGLPSLRTAHGAAEHGAASWSLRRLYKLLLAAADDQFAMRVQQRVVAVTDELATQMRAALPTAQVETISNGIDVAAVRALAAAGLAARRAPPPWQIAIIGRLVPVKRVDLFIAMADTLAAHNPGAYQFHVVGDGPLRATLEAQAAQTAARDCIKFHGFQTDALTLIATMHALVNTSDHEGLPMTALEALALDLRVIARAVGGLVALLTGNPRAHLVNSSEPGAFVAAVTAALPAGGELSSAGEERAALPAAYTLQASVDSYVRLYAAVVGT